MSLLDEMNICLKALTDDVSERDYRLDDGFFSDMGGEHDVRGGEATAHVTLTRVDERTWHMALRVKGEVVVPCDRCLDDMRLPVDASESLTVRLCSGPAQEQQDDEDTIFVEEREALLQLAWPIMEAILLDIPIQHVHETGLCNDAMVKALEEHSAARSGEGETDGATPAADDSWKEKLKQIKL